MVSSSITEERSERDFVKGKKNVKHIEDGLCEYEK